MQWLSRRAKREHADPPRAGEPFSVAFAGGMYAWPYYCGVAVHLRDAGLLHPEAIFYATSSGNVAALALTLGLDIEREAMAPTMTANDEHNHRYLGPYLHPAITQESFFGSFAGILPDDAHARASGKLHVIVTQLAPRPVRRVVSTFASREGLLSTVAASMAIPGHGVRLAYDARPHGLGWCLDGGLSGGSCESDERPGWGTLRVAVSPKLVSMVARVDLCPSRPIHWRELFTIQSNAARRELFELGKLDSERFFRAG
jgi:hypothetical protein